MIAAAAANSIAGNDPVEAATRADENAESTRKQRQRSDLRS
jgi:hypothetical protein